MRIHVVGIGSVGSFVAFHLRRSLAPKHAVVAVHHSSPFQRIATRPDGLAGTVLVEHSGNVLTQEGVEHEGLNPRPWNPDTPNILSPWTEDEAQAARPPIESLILTCKAYASVPALRALRSRISPDTTIVLLQNGMGNYEHIISSLYPNPSLRPNFVLASNTHGVYSRAFLHTVHAGLGEIQLGIVPDPRGHNFERREPGWGQELSLDSIAAAPSLSTPSSSSTPSAETPEPRYVSLRNTIAALTNSPGLNASWRPFWDVQMALRRKLVVNAFVNPLSALLGVRNGDVLSAAHGSYIADAICNEAESVFRKQWTNDIADQRRAHMEAQASRDTPLPFRPAPFPRAMEAKPLRSAIDETVENTKQNWSSMYMDIKRGQKTEIEYMTGYLVKIGRAHGLGMLTSQTVYNLLKMREARAIEERIAQELASELVRKSRL